MIQFKKISIRNFMSVGNEPIEFVYKKGLFYCYGENNDVESDVENDHVSNGTGKTVVLVDSILFCLYGRTQRNIKRKEIINIHNGSECAVSLDLIKDEDSYTIERQLAPDKISVTKNGNLLDEESAKRKANNFIVEEILDGISFEVFKNLIVLNGTASKHFFDYHKNEKRNFINEVFKLGFLDFLHSDLTSEVKEKKTELEKLQIVYDSKEKEIKRYNTLIESFEGNNINKQIETINKHIKEEEKKQAEILKPLKEIETKFLKNKTSDEFQTMIDESVNKIQEVNKLIQEYTSNMNTINNDINRMRKEYLSIKSENVCSHCTQPIPEELKERILENIKTEGKLLKSKLDEYTKLKNNDSKRLEKMNTWFEKHKNIVNDYRSLAISIQSSRDIVQGYKNQLSNMSNDSNNKKNKENVNNEISSINNEMKKLKEEIDSKREEFISLKVCKDIISDKNFYGYYMSVFRKYLNKSINEYLEKMNSPHRVKFNNDLEADVFNGESEFHSYDNLSTGEKSKINISLLLSFFDVLNNYHRMKTNILVLDEILDTGIDSQSVMKLHKILFDKTKENDKLGVYVVSHKNSGSAFAEQKGANKIIIEKNMGFTTIKES